MVVNAKITELPVVLASQAPGVQFDCIIGRNALLNEPDKMAAAQVLAQLLPQSGRLVLAETVPRHTQRLYRLLERQKLDSKLCDRLVTAEEAMYTDSSDPMLNWDAEDLRMAFEVAGLIVEVVLEQSLTQKIYQQLNKLVHGKSQKRLHNKYTIYPIDSTIITLTSKLLWVLGHPDSKTF